MERSRGMSGVFESRDKAIEELLKMYGSYYIIKNLKDIRDSGLDCTFDLVLNNKKNQMIKFHILYKLLNEID